ncbi:MAG: CinA family protein [Euryarchaeota archaeon]|nr:CinA family protein [Euryarchaeota archaeon]
MCFELIKDKKLKLATAESCTGGLLGSTITDVPGASAYYLGGVISYSNDAKINILGVKKETIERYGAVSEQCAKEMARGVAELFGADIAIATTGIAGPSGGTTQKPVGTVFIAYYLFGVVDVEKRKFDGSRREIKRKIAEHALNVLEVMVKKREF